MKRILSTSLDLKNKNMMPPEFSIGRDGSHTMFVLAQVQNKIKGIATNELTHKLTSVFGVNAVEEMLNQTACWAQQMVQTSKELDISIEALQALQIISKNIGLPVNVVTNMFANVVNTRNQALQGNVEFITSFQNLEITLDNLQTYTNTELFEKVLNNISNNIQTTSILIRQSIRLITGSTPENYINAINLEIKPYGGFGRCGEHPEGYMGAHLKEHDIVPEVQISQLGVRL